MEVLVEVKHEDEIIECTTAPPSPSVSSPPTSLPQDASTPKSDYSLSSSEGGAAAGPVGLQEYWEQRGDYIIELVNRQHRLFIFMILFVNERARLLRLDRTGASMTPEFDYIQHPEIIGKFLYRLSRQSDDARGYDPTVVPASEAEAELFRNLHTRCNCRESAVVRGLADAAMDSWPIYKLTIEGHFTPDDRRAVLRNDPVSRREFLIGKPMTASRSLCGRGTKAHVAYDIMTKKIVVIKDSWRPNSDNVRPEYDTYLLLSGAKLPPHKPFSIPTLLGGGDVTWNDVAQETRTSNPDILTRTHFRLVLKEVCRPLEDFTNSLELVTAIMFALDAHKVAWLCARILHRDVSIGNILILDEDPEGSPNPQTAKGLLADWDLARTKDELENPVFTQKTRRAGTWPFISARLQHTGPEQCHELSDDLEPFVHILNYCAVKYLPNKLSTDNVRLARFISDVYDCVRESGGLDKGSHEKLERLIGNKPFVELQNPTEHPLSLLLQTLSELCYHHYHHIQFALPKSNLIGPEKVNVGRGRLTRSDPAFAPDTGAPADIHSTLAPATAPLPPPDPSESPLNTHVAIGKALFRTLEPPSEHPVIEWPA